MKDYEWNEDYNRLEVIFDDDECDRFGLSVENFMQHGVDFTKLIEYVRANIPDVPDTFGDDGLLLEVCYGEDGSFHLCLTEADASCFNGSNFDGLDMDSAIPYVEEMFGSVDDFVSFMSNSSVSSDEKAEALAHLVCEMTMGSDGEKEQKESSKSKKNFYFCRSFSSLNDIINCSKFIPDEKSFVAKEHGEYFFVIKVHPSSKKCIPYLNIGGHEVQCPVAKESYFKEHNLMIIKEDAISICRKLAGKS
jgi:negative regulator of genetic competence, sporulation and motility